MDKYDIVIIGAGTSGAYLAKRMAEKGHSTLVIEKSSKAKVGTKYDIFHIEAREFSRLGIPRPEEGDPEWAFEFEKNYNADPLTLYPKLQRNHVVGLHLHEYTLLMDRLAEEAGAKIVYGAEFLDFTFEEDGKINGVTYKYRGAEKTVGARIVADCSGINAEGRTKLPDGYGIENGPLTDEDMFYVILKYVKLKNPKDYLDGSTFWAAYKSWIAPCADPEGAIIGLGACHSFEYAEKMFEEMEKTVPLPEYELIKVEKGRTPYTRHPHSLVADNFIVSGDAGSLTKSANGEGVTSSIYELTIAVNTLDRALKLNKTSKEYLWEINKKYNETQGAEFAFLRALLVGVVNAASFDEYEYAFKSGIISDELLNAMVGSPILPKTLIEAASAFVSGLTHKNIRVSTVKAAVKALKNAMDISAHYKNFPSDPGDFESWTKKTDEIYMRIGKIK
ncbi:MAG: NAD(P)/FAD-dependent oxidoreductase [Clostridia bacterium]|nr:NAD(P)/FAD-dependent oxidoreductase [Clostridia bacterium]